LAQFPKARILKRGYRHVKNVWEVAYRPIDAVATERDFYLKYPVRQATRERYNSYIQAFMTAQGVKRNIELLQKRFGDTYWFYLHFNEPATLQKSDEKNRY